MTRRSNSSAPSIDSVRSTNALLSEKDMDLKDERSEPVILPVDGGREAWLFMVGSVMVDAIIWGFPLNFGIFQNYYTTHEPFLGNQYIPMIGTFAMGISYLGGPIMIPLTLKFHHCRQGLICFGVGLCVLGTLGASFATELWQLVVFQGILYGLGLLVVSYVVFSQLNEWFVERRGLAYGVQLSASGFGGLFLPFILQKLLETYGYATTLRIYILIIITFVGPPIFLLRSRPRVATEQSHHKSKIDYSVLRKPIFYFLAAANLLQGLAFYIPIFYLPSIATSLSTSATETAVLLALLNASHVLGLLTMGYLSDHLDVFILLFTSTFCSSVTVLFLLGPAKTFTHLLIFSLLYGFLGGGFESLFPRFVTALTKDPEAELLFYGVFEFESGLGIVLAGPVSAFLMNSAVDLDVYGLGAYEGIVLFVGITLGMASIGGLGWLWERRGNDKNALEYDFLHESDDEEIMRKTRSEDEVTRMPALGSRGEALYLTSLGSHPQCLPHVNRASEV